MHGTWLRWTRMTVAGRQPHRPLIRQARRVSSVAKYPTHAESAIVAAERDSDANDSHLVCGKCTTPISKTQDLVFFKWRNGIHMSSLTDAPLQHLRTSAHFDHEDHAWKRHKLHCLKCNASIGSIARVYASDKILFSAKDCGIQMPVHQSPMLSLSGYPSSMLGFSMWTELLLILESQPYLKNQLQIRRIDNISEFTAEKKELNSKIMMIGDLRSLLRFVGKHLPEMNQVNLLTAWSRIAALKHAETKNASHTPNTRQHFVSEAPEDDLWDVGDTILLSPTAVKAEEDEMNEWMWKVVDAMEGLVCFGGGAMQHQLRLTGFTAALWRLNIGRPSLLRGMANHAIRMLQQEEVKLNAPSASLVASCTAHLASKDIRHEPWMQELLCLAADVVLADKSATSEGGPILEILLPLARSFVLTGYFHEGLFRCLFSKVNEGVLDQIGPLSKKLGVWQVRLFQIHMDNALQKRGSEFLIAPGTRLDGYRAKFEWSEKTLKNRWFRLRHLVSSSLESMQLQSETLYTFNDTGYIADVVLEKLKIAIEIVGDESYLTIDRSPPGAPTTHSGDPDVRSIDTFKMLPFVDLKARHLEHHGWIVVQLPADEFVKLKDPQSRVEYLSMLIEIATYARAQELEVTDLDVRTRK